VGTLNSESASFDPDLGTSSNEAIAVDVLNALTASEAVTGAVQSRILKL